MDDATEATEGDGEPREEGVASCGDFSPARCLLVCWRVSRASLEDDRSEVGGAS